MLNLILAVAQLQVAGAAVPADSIEKLRREARRAEANFERLSRRLIPIRFGPTGTECDEIVGRFCLTYDEGRPRDPEPEDGRVVDARRTAIEALRRAFTFLPADFETAAPLVRYLVEDERAEEAASAARLYFLSSGDTIWGPMLAGFASHAAGSDTAAQRLFGEVLPRLEPEDRERILNLEWLLESSDRGAYRRMQPAERRSFEQRFWALSDPLYMTPGNERWTEHVARHVWSRVLARAPMVTGMFRWGSDLEQITVRYGVPVGRTRAPPTSFTNEGTMTEHFDPDQLAFTPAELAARGVPPPPLPGRAWELERERSRSGYAPASLRRVIAMPHQVTRFPSGDGYVLRLDGRFTLDSIATGHTAVSTALHVLDAELRPVGQRSAMRTSLGDTVEIAFEFPVSSGDAVYSLEAIEPETRLAGRARYFIDRLPPGKPRLSDPLLARPWRAAAAPTDRLDPALDPLADLVLAPNDTVGLYAEITGLAAGGSYRVRLSVQPADRASLPARVVSWIGRQIGLASEPSPTRLEWTATADAAGRGVISVELFPRDDGTGDRVLRLRITDLASGLSAESRRVFRIGPPPT